MIILRTPKGWTCPKELDGHKLEGSWRAHQIPITDPVTNPAHLKLVEQWMRSYRPEELFDENGTLIAGAGGDGARGDAADYGESACEWRAAAQAAGLPDFRDYAVKVEKPGQIRAVVDGDAGDLPGGCDAAEHDQLPRVRAG